MGPPGDPTCSGTDRARKAARGPGCGEVETPSRWALGGRRYPEPGSHFRDGGALPSSIREDWASGRCRGGREIIPSSSSLTQRGRSGNVSSTLGALGGGVFLNPLWWTACAWRKGTVACQSGLVRLVWSACLRGSSSGLDEEPDPAMPAWSPKGVTATMRRGRPVTKVVDPWETPLCYPALCRETRGRDRMLGSVPQTPERSGGDQHHPVRQQHRDRKGL